MKFLIYLRIRRIHSILNGYQKQLKCTNNNNNMIEEKKRPKANGKIIDFKFTFLTSI